MIKPIELAEKYMESFFGKAPLETMESLFAEDLIFEGPYLNSKTAKDYLQALQKDPPVKVNYEMEEIFEKENSVCLIYQFSKLGLKTRMVKIFEVADGKICKIKLVFDTSAFT